MRSVPTSFARPLGLALAISALSFCQAYAADWPPISPSELALTKPAIDPAADAEVLLWDVRLTDQRDGSGFATTFEHHLRVKVFTPRGAEAQGKVDLTYTSDARVRDVEGRTVAPGGAVTELRKQDIFDRTVVQASGVKVKSRSFAFPNVVPGAIVEYRWREVRDDSVSQNLELMFQRDIPAHTIRYHVKPLDLSSIGYGMRMQGFNVGKIDVTPEKEGYSLIQAANLPAFGSEPYAPPDLATKGWMLIYYVNTDKGNPPPEKFWNDFGRATFEELKTAWKVTSEVKAASTAAVAGTTTTPEKIAALVRAVRTQLKRNDVDTAPDALTNDRKVNKTASDALKRGVGNGSDMNLLFAAMASAAGLDAHLALFAGRDHMFSEPALKQPYLLRHLAVAIKDGADWRFVDPAEEHAPGGHLRWQHEGMQALVLDARAPAFVMVPDAPPDYSSVKRSGTFTLADNGTLEGRLTFEYAGHLAVERRESDDDETNAERRNSFADELRTRMPGAEVTEYAVSNLDDPEQPYVVTATLRVPSYAQRAGSRLLVQPAVYQHNRDAALTASSRRQPIDFRRAWTEADSMVFELPEGFVAEALTSPEPVIVDKGVTARYEIALASKDPRHVTYTRRFMVGGGGNILFGRESYPAWKGLFDGVHEGDAHSISLRRNAQ